MRLAMEFGGLARVALETGDRAQVVQSAGESGPVVDAFGQAARLVEEPAGPRHIATRQRALPLVTEVLPLGGDRVGGRPNGSAAAASGRKPHRPDAGAGGGQSMS